ncbi:MAG: TetR/AcrR family transcriptional regulator [Acidobacteriota bacterium]
MARKLNNDRALRIVAAAKQEFAKRGFAGARVERIAREARVNKQLLFYYFQSKRGLFQAAVRRATEELEAALGTAAQLSGRPLDRLRQLLSTLYEFLELHPDLVALLANAERPDGTPLAPPIRRIVVLLAEGQGLGLVRDDIDPHVAAAQALVLMLGYLRLEPIIAASAPPLAADEPALRERWRRAAVELVVNGVRAG